MVRNGYQVYSWGSTTQSGDISSGAKPIISTYLLKAIQDGIIPGPDAKVADVVPDLATLGTGKNATMTWRHLASMTSGYGLEEAPGAAFGYNDYAIHLYLLSLMKAFDYTDINQMIRETLITPLGLQDAPAHGTSGTRRLNMSVRDWARVGLMYLNKGTWGETQVINSALAQMAVSSPVWTTIPRTSGTAAPMLTGAATFGGTYNQTSVLPGHYSFNWWLNSNWKGEKLVADLPGDAYSSDGHWGRRKLWVIPSQNLVVAWNGSSGMSGDAETLVPSVSMAAATKLMKDMVLPTPEPTCDPGTIEVPGPVVTVTTPAPPAETVTTPAPPAVTVTTPAPAPVTVTTPAPAAEIRTVEVPVEVRVEVPVPGLVPSLIPEPTLLDRAAPTATVKATVGAKGAARRRVGLSVEVNEASAVEVEVRGRLKGAKGTVIVAEATNKALAPGIAWTTKFAVSAKLAKLVTGSYTVRVAVVDNAGNRANSAVAAKRAAR